MGWTWQLTDTDFVPIGEILNAKEMKLSLAMNKASTASFQIRLDNPLARTIAESLGYLKIFRNEELLFFGPIVTGQEAGEGDNSSMHINATGMEWIFTQRLVGKTFEGINVPTPAESRAAMFVKLLGEANAEGETHIDYTTGPFESSTVGYITSPFKTLAEVLNDFSNTFDGFDWRVKPIDNLAKGVITENKIGRLEIASVLSNVQPNAVFEWGGGRNNVASFTRLIDRSTLLNRGYNISAAGPDATGAPTIKAEDKTSIEQWGLQEGLVNASILNTEARQLLVNENVEVRKNPRITVAFQPVTDDETGRVPTLGRDFVVGDQVPIRVSMNGLIHFEGLQRLWGADFALDENMKETCTLTLSDPN